MANYSTVPCEEVFGTATEDRSSVGWTRSVTLQVTAANKDLLIQDLLGTPRQHPSNPQLVADSCGSVPVKSKYTAAGQEIVYTDFKVTVNYSIPGGDEGSPSPEDPIKLVSDSLEPYTQVITQHYEDYVWASDDEPLKDGEEPGKVINGIKFVRTLFYVTIIPDDLLTFPGCVHNASFASDLLDLTFAAETLLFVGPVLNRTITTAGTSAWNLKMSWDYNENGWNKVWRGGKDMWDSLKLTDGGAAYNIFTPKDMSEFLK